LHNDMNCFIIVMNKEIFDDMIHSE
jgi:hypothetical protein